jgi:glutamate--cysteine ligase catalytic subunit
MDPTIADWIREIGQLQGTALDDQLAQHVQFLFQRDALVVYEDPLDEDDGSTKFFENFQSTNWNSVRFKPPPSLNSAIPWRVEFRTLEV